MHVRPSGVFELPSQSVDIYSNPIGLQSGMNAWKRTVTLSVYRIGSTTQPGI